MGQKLVMFIFILLLLPFYTVQAADVSASSFLHISISDDEGTIERVSKSENWKSLNNFQPITDKPVWLKVEVTNNTSGILIYI